MVQGEPVHELGAQIFAWAPTKSYVQTSVRAREPGTDNLSEWGLRFCSHLVPEHQAQKKQTRAHREPMPTSVPEYKVSTLYSGMDTVLEFWRRYLIKRCVHISAQRESYSGTVC